MAPFLTAFAALCTCAWLGEAGNFPCGEDMGDVSEKKKNLKKCRACKAGGSLVYHPEFAEGLGYTTCSEPHETGWEGFEAKQPRDLSEAERHDVKEVEPEEHELTSGNWDKRTRGQKNVFVKFFAPWCGHCLSMKKDFHKLVDDYKGSKTYGVWSVDCIGSGKSLCDKFGVNSFPQLKFGDPAEDPDSFQKYGGPRTYEAMKEFVSSFRITTEPSTTTTTTSLATKSCKPGNLDVCSVAEKASIDFYMKKSIKYLTAEVKRLDKDLEGQQKELVKRGKSVNKELKKTMKMIAAKKNEEDRTELESEKARLEKDIADLDTEFQALEELAKESDFAIIKEVKEHKERLEGHDEL